ncbi:haloacid dehalogenase type II [Oceanomicrobium pacificus]|uniref:(S)-2-haloacid dehalogenase n=1 Tax=Oceanomicrobium pacificus TaxID=2692916 RepID=A0A6B0TVE4_9RHOB|nr:haloacid dehalogenase type II [Oceanomicrobium pacificus]MXU64943.1 haloacid dehalogenase type II [Oceanomicrobium pacificus]
MAVQALIFDVFGTLVDWRGSIARQLAPVFTAKGIGTDPAAFADAWRARYDPAMDPVREGLEAYRPLDDLHLENLRHTLLQFGLSDRFETAELDEMNRVWERLDPWEDVVPALTRLKRDYLIAPCSNGSIAMMARLATHGALPWDCVLGADIARSYKPDPEVYRAAVNALRLDAGEVVMVASHNGDLAAAAACGLKTAFVPRPGEHGPGQTSDLRAEGAWTWVAEDLVQLCDLLDGPAL